MAQKTLIERWIRPAIRASRPYGVADSAGLVKLDAMENPHLWPSSLRQQWMQRLKDIAVNRYPDPRATELKHRLRSVFKIQDGLSLLLGNGSDELIQIIQSAVGGEGRTILSPAPGFVVYEMVARANGLNYVSVDLDENYALDVAAMLSAIDDHQPAVVFLAYPNNPTGNCFERSSIDQVIRRCPGLVVLDEAYFHFADDSYLEAIIRHDNLLVMRTLSKYGLAGLRIGVLIGPPAWIDEFDKIRLPYNVGVLSQEATSFALQNESVFSRQIRQIRQQRGELITRLRAFPDLQVFDSACNFVLFRLKKGSANDLHHHLLEKDILIKNLHASHPALSQCLRVTVGTESENRQFLSALRCYFDIESS